MSDGDGVGSSREGGRQNHQTVERGWCCPLCPVLWSACWSCHQPGFLGREETRLLMSLHVPGGWAQVAMWVVSPGLTLTVCSNRGLRYSTGIHWKLGLLLLLGLVPRSRELSCVRRAQPLWVGEQAQEPGSCWLHSLVSGSGHYFGAFSRFCMLLLKASYCISFCLSLPTCKTGLIPPTSLKSPGFKCMAGSGFAHLSFCIARLGLGSGR